MINNICVYFHIIPSKNEVFYVGIGKLERAYSKDSRNDWWYNITKKYDFEVLIVNKEISWEEACQLEMKYISEIGRRDLGLGTLVNLTNGGEGNIELSQDVKDKISEKLKGRKLTVETRNKISEKLKGKKVSDETKIRMSLGRIWTPLSEEVKLKISNSKKGKKTSEEVKKKISESCKGNKHSEETRKKISSKRKGIKFSEETRKKMSLARKGKKFKKKPDILEHQAIENPSFKETVLLKDVPDLSRT